MKVLVTGVNGQLGSEFKKLVETRQVKGEFVFTGSSELDLLDMPKVSDFIRYGGFDWILNFAGYTAVDKAEEEQNKAYALNRDAVFNMVQAAEWIGAKFVHISTDYVFDGRNYKPYTEEDRKNPLSVYGKSKSEGEDYVLRYFDGMVIRTSWLYSAQGHNFVKTMLRLANERDEIKIVYDQIGTPTSARDLAGFILHVLEAVESGEMAFQPGVFHYSNEGVASWYDFALAVFEIAGIDIKVVPITTSEFPTPAQRPYYSVLAKEKVKRVFGCSIEYWKESLRKILKDLLK